MADLNPHGDNGAPNVERHGLGDVGWAATCDDLDNFADFVRSATPRIRMLVNRLGHNCVDTEDVVQEALSLLFFRWRQISNPLAWVLSVARNVTLNHMRRHSREIPCDWNENSEIPASKLVEDLVIGNALMFELLTELPPRQRLVLVLTARGLEPKEIAEEISISPHVVRAYLRSARRNVRRRIAESNL